MERGKNKEIIKKLNYTYDHKQIYKVYENIRNDFLSDKQICIQHSDSCTDKYRDGVGKLGQRDEHDFCHVNDKFKGTVIEKILSDTNGYRARIMISTSKTCYSMHRDVAPRIHIALDTHDECGFIFPNWDRKQWIEIPQDNHLYWVNTCAKHTFVNAGRERVHLVFVSDKINNMVGDIWQNVKKSQ